MRARAAVFFSLVSAPPSFLEGVGREIRGGESSLGRGDDACYDKGCATFSNSPP